MLIREKPQKQLEKWFKSTRRKPLVLRGARQVGKSTLVEEFARTNNLNCITINCEKNRSLDSIFESLDISRIILELNAVSRKTINAEGSLLFLDEIQATPHALQALRYFYEERPEIPLISAGSLLEFTLSEHSFSMPVGRIQYLYLGPLTINEFITAIDPQLIEYLESIDVDAPLPVSAHNALCGVLRKYLFCGGMPEAVAVYKETRSMEEVEAVHHEIIDTYIDDFAKYARAKELALLQRIFLSVPRLLGQKVKYVNLAREERAANVRSMIELLSKAQIITPIYHSHCSGIPLSAQINPSVFKLAFLDVGLANTICGMSWQDIPNSDDVRLINEGGMAEQFIAQHIAMLDSRKPEITYWQREARSSNAEVDFVWAKGTRIYPVEVKAGKSGTLKSLQQFVLHTNVPTAIRFDANPPSRQRITGEIQMKDARHAISYKLISLPLYAVCELPRILGMAGGEL